MVDNCETQELPTALEAQMAQDEEDVECCQLCLRATIVEPSAGPAARTKLRRKCRMNGCPSAPMRLTRIKLSPQDQAILKSSFATHPGFIDFDDLPPAIAGWVKPEPQPPDNLTVVWDDGTSQAVEATYVGLVNDRHQWEIDVTGEMAQGRLVEDVKWDGDLPKKTGVTLPGRYLSQ